MSPLILMSPEILLPLYKLDFLSFFHSQLKELTNVIR